jgi:YD repeat-containing protein
MQLSMMGTEEDVTWGGRATAIAAVVALLSAWPPAPAAAESYTYDAIGRLTAATYDNGGSIHYIYDANGNILSIVASLATSGVEESPDAPLQFALGGATPNPGSGPKTISFSIPSRGPVTLRVFDASGRMVATLADGVYDPGRYLARFSTDRLAGGVYFYRLAFDGRALSGRMVLLR